jgi:hypothetical protein
MPKRGSGIIKMNRAERRRINRMEFESRELGRRKIEGSMNTRGRYTTKGITIFVEQKYGYNCTICQMDNDIYGNFASFFYAMVQNREEMPRKIGGSIKPGSVASLPTNEKIEILLVEGGNCDNSLTLSKMFKIVRDSMNNEDSRMLGLEEIPIPQLVTSIHPISKCFKCNPKARDVCKLATDKDDSWICQKCSIKGNMEWFWENISKTDYPVDQKASDWYLTLLASEQCQFKGCFNKGYYLLRKRLTGLEFTWLCNDCLRLMMDNHKNSFLIPKMGVN